MRPSSKSRSRNKSGNNQNRRNVGNVVNRVFESAGPDGKVRGTPQQIIDKYQALARDAQVSGDRVAAENYLQHAEHYARLLGDAQRQMNEGRDRDEREDRDEAGQRYEGRFDGRFDSRFDGPRDDEARDQGREGGQRDQGRDMGQRDHAERENGQRDGGQRDRRREDRRPRVTAEAEGFASDDGRDRAAVDAFGGSEPAGLTTLGEEHADSGPVETPEEAARRRDAPPEPPATMPLVNGEHPEPAAASAEAAEAPAPKRSRTRRKPKTALPAEAGAD